MTKTDRHRAALACVAGGSHAGGCFHWRCFPRVHAIAGCIGDGSGMCLLCIAQHDHLWFLHVLGSYWTMCWVPIVSHVSFLLPHMSCCGWIMCHFFIGPCVIFYWSTWLFLIGPRVTALSIHISYFYSTTWLLDFLPCVRF